MLFQTESRAFVIFAGPWRKEAVCGHAYCTARIADRRMVSRLRAL